MLKKNYGKTITALFVLFCCGSIILAEESFHFVDSIFWNTAAEYIRFSNDKMEWVTIDMTNDVENKKTGSYRINYKQGIPFINVTWDKNEDKEYLILIGDAICSLYDSDGKSIFYGTTERMHAEVMYGGKVTATSYLKEKQNAYLPENINVISLERPWVEGVEGQGIHEKLFILQNPWSDVFSLYISIGYVSFSKPCLYQENSRPKKILISADGCFSFEYDLTDTPSYQTIKFPQPLKKNTLLEIEILEVYPGTKYEDTCINAIIFDSLP